MYLRFLRFLIEFFSGLSLVAIPLIIINFFAPNFAGLPWEAELDDISKMYENFTGVNPYPNMTEYKNTSSNPLLSWLTVENVHPDSDLWYLYMVASYAFSIFAFCKSFFSNLYF